MYSFWSTNNELYRLAIFHVVKLKTYEKNRVSSKKELLIPVGRFSSLVPNNLLEDRREMEKFLAALEYVLPVHRNSFE
jgi:hypothetical protein